MNFPDNVVPLIRTAVEKKQTPFSIIPQEKYYMLTNYTMPSSNVFQSLLISSVSLTGLDSNAPNSNYLLNQPNPLQNYLNVMNLNFSITYFTEYPARTAK